ncbi:hypothetical protein AGLY_008616 [Aphis glycines]|uniref:Uncharacterized protein n=1 Tax=Aphis glycines TaxID=307491 RepID=A0A6G0TLS6_APHGL|nr:hypothetical protein AGLY_008616 [Aphis glycines]
MKKCYEHLNFQFLRNHTSITIYHQTILNICYYLIYTWTFHQLFMLLKITIQSVYPLDFLEGFEVVPLKPSSKAYGCILFASKLISAGASSFRQKKDSKIELEDLHPMKVTCNPSSLGLSDRLRITEYIHINFRMICVFFIFASVYLSTAKLVEIKLQFKFVETVFDGKLNIVGSMFLKIVYKVP